MTVYAFPSLSRDPTTSAWRLTANTGLFRSPITGAVQTVGRTGTRWEISLLYQNVSEALRAEMQAFVAKLHGQEHRFYVWDHAYSRRGSGSGGLVNGASQTGSSLITDGWPTSTLIFREGDQLSYDAGTNEHELKIVTADVTTDGSGNATISISPEIHISPANNQAIRVSTPYQTCVLASPTVGWSNKPGVNILSDLTIEAVGVFAGT